MNYRKTDYTDEVNAILNENKRRLTTLRGSHSQVTGRGMDGHTHKVVIDGYPIRTQYLTDEVASNGLYKMAAEAGSIYRLQQMLLTRLNKENEGIRVFTEDDISEDSLIELLMFVRCQRDPSFAFAVVFKIKHKKLGKDVPFLMNYAQRMLLVILEDMRRMGVPIRLVLVKARQWGGSTLVQLYMAWVQLFVKEGWYSAIIAQTKDTAKRIKGMYKKVLDNIPSWVFKCQKVVFSPYMGGANDSILTDEKGNILRSNVITIASYENHESTRGFDYAMVHCSEVAYWKTTKERSAESVITNIEGNLLEEPLTLEVFESTARGMAGFFYEECKLAKEGKSARKYLFIPFFYIENDMKEFRSAKQKRDFALWLCENKNQEVAPDATHESGQYLYGLWVKGASLEHINWYIEKRKGHHSHESMASEAPSDDIECFAYSGNRVFSIDHVMAMQEECERIPIWRGSISSTERLTMDPSEKALKKKHIPKVTLVKDDFGLLQIWKHPDKLKTDNQYLVVVDVGGRSEKADYSVITVINRWHARLSGGKLEVVARWRGHLRYDKMAWVAVAIARYYKNAKLVFESNTFDKKKAEATDFVEQGDHIRGILSTIGKAYKNLYKRKATNPEDIKKGIKTKIGFQTNSKTKQDMVDQFIKVFEDGKFIDPDKVFYQEAAIYEQRADGSYGNIEGKDNHDDVVMTDMIGSLVDLEIPKASLARIEDSEHVGKGTINESSFSE